MASVKVAVRVRPINKRERDMESKVIIEMNGKKTSITNPQMSSDVKDFTYDYSYWSMDSRDKHFASQEQVFCDLGTDVIDSAFEGYNACIFAYGQTGSGKSYTMMGCQDAVGLIPRICEALYERMSRDQAENQNKVEFKTEVSYLEIYNERVRDLLRPAPKKGDAFNLKVREHPKEGPYVQDLTKHIVSKYVDIEKLMDVGNDNRTTASTNMNDTSSRSHAIFTLNFTQAKFYADMPSETVSKIHLVDLAGSERADSTGATGQRLKEGANINKSLVTLGSVISALAELSSVSDPSAKKKHFIPYRDSVLTWLLKDSLGGNAKTIMIAAISPADVNYAETVSTLRYANRAKNIINKPTINEDANVRLIRELREEIENLRLMLTRSNPDGVASASISAEEKRMAEQLHKNEAQVQSLYKEWNNKWKETHKIMEEKALAFRRDGFGIKMESDLPHLICVDGDILSTGVTLYHLGEGRTHVGREDARVKQDIVLSGPGLEAEHCIFESIEGNVTLHPIASETHVNGSQVKKPLRLSQGAVILLGKTNMFRFNHPGEAARLRQKYASVENLASLVPTRELEEPSYLFYNAGLEMERRYRQEAQELETKRREIEKMQAEDAKKLEEARKELEILADQRKAAEEEQRKELSETQRHLEEQREHLQRLKAEQDKAREKAQRELHELKSRIQDQQEEEKRKLDEEMRRLLHMKEVNQKTVEEQEALLAKRQEDLERQLAVERQKIEEQRKEVLRLQQEYEGSRTEAAPGERVGTTNDVETTAHSSAIASVSPRAEELRRLLDKLEAEYESAMSTAQREIQLAKNQLKQAEMATLQGKVNLMDGKSQLQMQWKQLDALHLKHKGIQDEIQGRIREVRAQLEAAEKTEEEELMAQERSIVERRKARKRVEEATQKLLEMENRLSRSEALTDNQDLLDWQNQEEVREMQEQRNILMELLSNHQIALLKASQLVTETKTKLENHLKNEAMLVGPLRERIADCELELEPLRKEEMQLERACQNLDTELKAKKKILYKQRKRINLLEKQHAQSSGPAGRDGLSQDERDELDREREAELELIQREKSVLRDMEDVFRRDQETAEAKLNFQTQDLEKRKSALTACLSDERRKLDELQKIHDETREFIEAELMGRREMLDRIKEKVKNDKKELARLDTKQQQTAAQAAEELFMMAEVLEKELSESGKKEELTKIKDHRKKLQELDRQLRLAEKREKMALDGQAAGDQQCVIL